MNGSNGSNKPRYCGCGTRLAHSNAGDRCAICQAKARDLRAHPPEVPAQFWTTDQMVDALAAWHMGQVIAAYRANPHHGSPLPQEVVAGWVGVTQAQLSRIETGPPIKDLDKLIQWARTLRIPAHLLWFKVPTDGAGHDQLSTPKTIAPDVRVGPDQSLEEVDATRRRALLTASLAAPFTALLSRNSRHVRTEDSWRIRRAIPQLYKLDDQEGGDAVGSVAASCLSQVDELLNVGDYDDATGRELQVAYGELAEMVGWVDFDAGRYGRARLFYGEAMQAADLAGDRNLEVLVLASMNTLARYRGRPREAIQLIQLAQRRAAGWAPPRLEALLAAREAVCWAQFGDSEESRRAMHRADDVFHPGIGTDDPPWIDFFDGAELAARRATAAEYLGRPDQAAQQMRASVDDLGAAYQRNRAYYSVRLGLSHLAEGDQTQACSVVEPVLPLLTDVKSHRAHARLREFCSGIEDSRAPQAHELIDHANDLGLIGQAA